MPEIEAKKGSQEALLKTIQGQLAELKDLNSAQWFYNTIGARFAASGHLDAAEASFLRLLELEPLSSDAHFNLGLAYWQQGEKRKAIFEFKTALKIDPRHIKSKDSFLKSSA